MNTLSLGQGKTAVSALQEMMQKRSAPVPIYKEKGGIGPPFIIVCQVDQLITEVGFFLYISLTVVGSKLAKILLGKLYLKCP